MNPKSYLSLLDLSGRNFVVLGAGQGIGAEACRALAQAGAKVICVDSDETRAAGIAGEVGGYFLTGDVTRRQDIQRLFREAAERAGSIDGIVDIVGAATTRSLDSFDDEAWDAQYAIVVRHVFLTLQEGAAAVARAGGGSITFVGSIAGTASIPGQAAYGSAKAALHQLVRTMAHELARKNIRVNAVAPGIVRTPRLMARLSEDEWRRVEDRIPLGHAAQPSEIAAALLFLASDMASHVTGHILAADGGLAAITPLPPVGVPE